MTRIDSNVDYLKFDEVLQIVKLQPALFNEAGVFTDSKIVFYLDLAPELNFAVTIQATIELCSVSIASFEYPNIKIGYFIGDDGSEQDLPDVV